MTGPIRADGTPIEVLLVEDDPGDVLMTREAFEHHKIRNQLHVVNDGEQAMQFLRQLGEYAGAPRPGLILLDLNLPRRDGLEVLAELKADPGLRVIPVVILTTSQAEEDIMRSYALHANAYVSKPVDFEHCWINRALLEALERFQFAGIDTEQRSEAINRKLFARLEFEVPALLDHLIESQPIFAAEREHNLLLQARIL